MGKEAILTMNSEKAKALLTDRDVEYLVLVALGCKNHNIANILNVTLSTVKKTLETIFRKLNAKDRANAVAIAFVHNFINAEIISELAGKFNI